MKIDIFGQMKRRQNFSTQIEFEKRQISNVDIYKSRYFENRHLWRH